MTTVAGQRTNDLNQVVPFELSYCFDRVSLDQVDDRLTARDAARTLVGFVLGAEDPISSDEKVEGEERPLARRVTAVAADPLGTWGLCLKRIDHGFLLCKSHAIGGGRFFEKKPTASPTSLQRRCIGVATERSDLGIIELVVGLNRIQSDGNGVVEGRMELSAA